MADNPDTGSTAPTEQDFIAFSTAVHKLSETDASAAMDTLNAGRARFSGNEIWQEKLGDLSNWVREDMFNQLPPELQEAFASALDAACKEVGVTIIEAGDWPSDWLEDD
jgi:hypothetical protein